MIFDIYKYYVEYAQSCDIISNFFCRRKKDLFTFHLSKVTADDIAAAKEVHEARVETARKAEEERTIYFQIL